MRALEELENVVNSLENWGKVLNEGDKSDLETFKKYISAKKKKIQELKEKVSKPLPQELTAENGAKAALMGRFFVILLKDCSYCYGTGYEDKRHVKICMECNGTTELPDKIPVSWTTIKEIWKKAVEYFERKPSPSDSSADSRALDTNGGTDHSPVFKQCGNCLYGPVSCDRMIDTNGKPSIDISKGYYCGIPDWQHWAQKEKEIIHTSLQNPYPTTEQSLQEDKIKPSPSNPSDKRALEHNKEDEGVPTSPSPCPQKWSQFTEGLYNKCPDKAAFEGFTKEEGRGLLDKEFWNQVLCLQCGSVPRKRSE